MTDDSFEMRRFRASKPEKGLIRINIYIHIYTYIYILYIITIFYSYLIEEISKKRNCHLHITVISIIFFLYL